jgi:hypothetical protein
VTLSGILDTARPRPGRRFQPTHELALSNDALAACGTLPGAQHGVLVVKEMAGPIGIPDLAAVVGRQSPLDARLALDVSPVLNAIDAAILASARANAALAPAAIARLLGWPDSTVNRRLPGLVRSGALQYASNGGVIRRSEIRPVGRLYAVETKVRDARAALHQVRTYSVWADSYVLVMGQLGEQALRNLVCEVRADQGGLMVAGRWVCRPQAKSASPAHRLWASEHVVAAVRGGTYQPSVLA